MGLTLRQTKGSPLTYDELDTNFVFLSSSMSSSLSPTGSFTGSFTGSLKGTSSFALTASYVPNTATFPYTGSAVISGSLIVTGSLNTSQGFTGSLKGTASNAISSSYTVGAISLTPSNSIIIPTASAVPNWTGTDGEIKPFVSGSVIALYAWLSGSWNQFVPAPRTYTITLTREQITGSLFTTGITISGGSLGLDVGYGAKIYRDQTTLTYNYGASPFTQSGGTFRIREVSGAQIVNQISQGEFINSGTNTNLLLAGDAYKISDTNGVYLESSAPITASDANSFIRVKLFYDIVNLNNM